MTGYLWFYSKFWSILLIHNNLWTDENPKNCIEILEYNPKFKKSRQNRRCPTVRPDKSAGRTWRNPRTPETQVFRSEASVLVFPWFSWEIVFWYVFLLKYKSKSNSLVYLNFIILQLILSIWKSLIEKLKGLHRPALEKDDLLQLDTPSYQWFTRKFYTVCRTSCRSRRCQGYKKWI